MKFSLSEFLNLIELRSQTWCHAVLAEHSGFAIPAGDFYFLYGVTSGRIRLALSGGLLELGAGEVVAVLQEAHAIRTSETAPAPPFPFLADGEYVDAPPDFSIGTGAPAARLLCGRLAIRWPGGQPTQSLPPYLRLQANSLVNFAAIDEMAHGPGAAALLTRLANLLFVEAFRRHPESSAVHREANLHDPIARAVQYIATHPFRDWSVESLARKVGMGRANFAARFVADLGKTPFEALTDERMKHAAAFVCGTDLKIVEIAGRVGYRSEAAFSRRFTAHFGISPGMMRRRAREEAAALIAGPA